jgi:phage tail sheath protein FI
LEEYGQPDPKIGFGHDCCLPFLVEGRQLWAKRVVNGATHAGVSYFVDDNSSPTKVISKKFLSAGSAANYEQQYRQIFVIKFNGALVPSNSVTVTMTNGTTTQTATYAVPASGVTSNQALVNWAAAIKTALDTYALGGAAEVLDVSASGTDDDRIIFVTVPSTVLLTFGAIVITLGATQTTAVMSDQCKLFDIFAENPGAWANQYGTKIVNVDQGIRQKVKLVFSAALVTSNTFTVDINDVTIGPITFATDSDTTMAAIAAAIAANANINSAVVTVVGGSVSNDREIIIEAKNSGLDKITVKNATVLAGASQATVAISEILTGLDSTNTFDLEIYDKSNPTVAVETFTVSMAEQVDGLGNQQNIAQVVNESPNKSKIVRVFQPDSSKTRTMIGRSVNSEWVVDELPNYLVGGTDGATPTSSNIRNGWDTFKNREEIAVRILINCGYTAPEVQQHMVSMARLRRDCFAILDAPSDQQSPADLLNYRRNVLNINNSYGALYAPDLKIVDQYTDVVRYVPPSGYVAAIYARTDRERAEWFAPAGLTRGLVENVLDLRNLYDQGARDTLDPNQINCIIKKPGKGIAIWGIQTLQSRKSALSVVPIRRMIIGIEIAIVEALDFSVFDPNDAFTRFLIEQQISDFLEPIKNGRGLQRYQVVCDESNNKNQTIDLGQLNVDVYLDPTRPAEKIKLQSIITKSGASFSELIATGGNF